MKALLPDGFLFSAQWGSCLEPMVIRLPAGEIFQHNVRSLPYVGETLFLLVQKGSKEVAGSRSAVAILTESPRSNTTLSGLL